MSRLSLALDTPDLAQHYEQASVDRQFKAGKELIERLQIKPGQQVLDIGAGTGLLAEHVAGIVGKTGSVTAIDPLPLRIEIAKRKARANLSFAVGDAYKLDGLAPESFDAIYLNAVFHWLPDKRTPLKSFLRLLKSGGRLGISTGSKDHVARLQAIKAEVLSRAPYNEHLQPEAGVSHRVSAGELGGLFEETGFRVVSIDVVPNTTLHATPEAAIEHSQASSFGNFLGHLPANLRDQAKAEILRELEKFRTPEGYRQDGARIFAIASKP
jgi:ubiquinone/menaquinone biosynthesis C-methylase UbiE